MSTSNLNQVIGQWKDDSLRGKLRRFLYRDDDVETLRRVTQEVREALDRFEVRSLARQLCSLLTVPSTPDLVQQPHRCQQGQREANPVRQTVCGCRGRRYTFLSCCRRAESYSEGTRPVLHANDHLVHVYVSNIHYAMM